MADKPIVLLDASYVNHLVTQASNLGTLAPLDGLVSKYDLRVSFEVEKELRKGAAKSDARKYLLSLLDGGVIARELNPLTDALITDGAISGNRGELATIEASRRIATENPGRASRLG